MATSSPPRPELDRCPAARIVLIDPDTLESSYATAQRIAQIPDHHIRALVGVYGPEKREENDKLADTIVARGDAVAKAYAIKA